MIKSNLKVSPRFAKDIQDWIQSDSVLKPAGWGIYIYIYIVYIHIYYIMCIYTHILYIYIWLPLPTTNRVTLERKTVRCTILFRNQNAYYLLYRPWDWVIGLSAHLFFFETVIGGLLLVVV